MRNGNRRRVERTGAELLLLMGFVVAVSVAALVSGDNADATAGEPLPATVSVAAPSRDLPGELSEREVRIEQLEPLSFAELAGRVAERIGVEAVLEDRPGRVAGENMVLKESLPFGLVMTGTVPEVLDELARLSGYDWTWSEDRLVFFRYADSEQREALRLPRGVAVDLLAAVAESGEEAGAARADGAAEPGESSDAEVAEAGRVEDGVPGQVAPGRGGRVGPAAVAALEGQGPAPAAVQVPQEPVGWEVDPERHETVEGVLRAWAERAGWNLAWETDRRFEVGAAATFAGGEDEQEGFLKAADALLAAGPMRRILAATAYPNRWLVVRDAGSAVR